MFEVPKARESVLLFQVCKVKREGGGRNAHFRHEVSNRDGKCVISGIINPEAHIQANNWSAFECHIFSLQHENLWDELGYGGTSVNPDDNYKIVVFDIDIFGLDGRVLDPIRRNPDDPHLVSN
ncbi:hypothetical protein C7212DRAFT_347358 [Tuber magnatum]|uniref:Uncharacterized protein n=1 Tax=Tuber magnatum TaxID=42249 RepID=A0A317SEU9_9PEZI|nr:hypothetical protein C7212DRAFT_347358 [Tuber magnatum]